MLVRVVEPTRSGARPSSEAVVSDIGMVIHQQRVPSHHRMCIIKTLVFILLSVDGVGVLSEALALLLLLVDGEEVAVHFLGLHRLRPLVVHSDAHLPHMDGIVHHIVFL